MAQIALGMYRASIRALYCAYSTAWVLHKDWVCAPIVGITKLERFDDVIGALDINLSEDEIKFLEEPYRPCVLAPI